MQVRLHLLLAGRVELDLAPESAMIVDAERPDVSYARH